MSRTGREGRFECSSDIVRFVRTPFDQKDKIHEVFRASVNPPAPGEGVGVELFGELLGPWDCEYRGRAYSGKRKEVVAHETFGLAQSTS